MSTDEILGGLALVLVLAVSSQLVARRLRIPAIVVLLVVRPAHSPPTCSPTRCLARSISRS